MFKLIMLGQAGAGKTSILNRFVDNNFLEDTLTTIGADLKSITLQLNETAVRL
jgi:GTPase SAR1 family protein